MADITKKVQTFYYRGPGGSLLDAPFLANIERVSKESDNGLGFVSFLPGTTFNSFSTLEDGKTYIIFSKSVPYTIPTDDVPRSAALPFTLTNNSGFSI